MKSRLLMLLFVSLMADSMFGWGLGLGMGLSLKNLLLYLILMIFAIDLAKSPRVAHGTLPHGHVHLIFCALIAFALVSWAANSFFHLYGPYNAQDGFVNWKGNLLDHYLFLLVFLVGLQSLDDTLWLQRWILLVIMVGNVLTVMDAYGMPNFDFIDVRGGGRVQGPLGESNQYGLFVAAFLPMILAKIWIERGLMRILYIMGSIASLWVLLLTVSRGAFVALIAGSGLAAIAIRRHIDAVQARRVVGAVIMVMLVALLLLGDEYLGLIRDRATATGQYGEAYALTSGRTWIWQQALLRMLDVPSTLLTGYGWSTFKTVFGHAPHSMYVGRFFELGFLGLGLFAGTLLATFLTMVRAIDTAPEGSHVKAELIGSLFGFSVLCVGIASVDLSDAMYFLWAYFGIALRWAAIARTPDLSMEAPSLNHGRAA